MEEFNAYQTAELAAAYDAVYEHHDDQGFWHAVADASGGGPLLELGCGTGRVLLPLARAGYAVTGLDLSPQMLERCRMKLQDDSAEVRDRVTLTIGDMTSFDLGRRYEAIFCAFNGFHHLRTVEEQLACLERCYAHLPPHGMLVLDLFNPDPPEVESAALPAVEDPVAEFVDWTEGRKIRRWMSACEYNRPLQCNDCEMTYEIVEADGSTRQLTETFPLRILYRYELEHLLARSGFRVVALYDGYDRSPFTGDSLGMIVVALRLADEEQRRT